MTAVKIYDELEGELKEMGDLLPSSRLLALVRQVCQE